jgi:hypothetical protein
MKSKALLWAVRTISVLVLAVATTAFSGSRTPEHFSGIINDYTPAKDAKGHSTGPWEVRGEWTLTLKGDSGKADFSAALTMENSDYWVLTNPNPPADPNTPSTRTPHTHHITMEEVLVTQIDGGFEVSGQVTVTANGGPAPFSSTPSTLTVAITGGSDVEFSNVTLTFAGGAAGHFGSQAIHGVVRKPKQSSRGDNGNR